MAVLSSLMLLLASDTDTDTDTDTGTDTATATATGITAISTIEDICCIKFSLSTCRG